MKAARVKGFTELDPYRGFATFQRLAEAFALSEMGAALSENLSMAEVTIGRRHYSWTGELTEDTLIHFVESGCEYPDDLPFASYIAHTGGQILQMFRDAGAI